MFVLKVTMKTHTIKTVLIQLFAPVICLAVILAYTHAKDTVGYFHADSVKAPASQQGSDMVTKTLSDLHTHVDKSALKSLQQTDMTSPAARQRSALVTAVRQPGMFASILDYLRLLQISLTIRA